MAKRLTTQQAMEARDSLGVSTEAVEQEFETPRNPVLKSGADIAAQQMAGDKEPEHSLLDETKAAFMQDNSFVRNLAADPEFLIDIGYDPVAFLKENKHRIDAMPGIDREELAEDIGSATSAEEANYRLGQMEGDFEREQMLIEGGGSALLLRMGAAILDPTDWALAAATGGIVGGLTKAGKTGRIITSAVAAGTASAGTEALLARDNAFRDEHDVMFAALAGITLGGGLASLSKGENDALFAAADDLAKGEIDAAAKKLGIPEDSAGAARRKIESLEDNTPLYRSTDEILDDMEAPEFKFKGWNWLLNNLQSKLFWSKADSVRKVSSALFEGGFMKDKSKTRQLTAEGRANQLQDVFERGVFADSLSDFKAWAKRNGHGSARRNFTTSTGEEFYSEVGLAMRGITDGISSEALSAASKIRKHMDGVHELANRAGVKGFDKAALEDYFPRMLSSSKFAEVRGKINDDQLREFYYDALMKANNDIPESVARKIVAGYVRTMRMKTAGIETDLLHGIRMDDVDKLREMFEGYDGLDELLAEIEHIKAKELADRGTVSFGKKRIQFDEQHSDLLKDHNGQTFTLRFTDMYENDARMVLARYGRAMHGHIAIAEKLGVGSRMEFEELKKQMASDIEEAGGDVKKEIQAIEDGYNLLLGQPIERFNPTGDGAKLSRTVSGYNYMARGGQFGVNALAEAGNIVGQGGLRSVFRMFTDLPKVLKRAQNGELEHSVARFAELAFAPGIQTLTKHAVRNLDELAEDFAGTSVISKLTAKLDPIIKSGGRFTSIASGLGPVTDATQRLSAITWIEKLARFAKNGRVSESQVKRLRANGINADMQERIFAMFNQAGEFRKGRLVDIDPAKWTDEEALNVFSQAASREVRNAIQMTDISTSTLLFHHPVGRLMFQFMRFPMDAVNKQLLRQMHHFDAETATAYSASIGIASLAYMAQTSIEFANDPEERARRLEMGNLAKVSFMRTGFSSMLPGMMDTGIQMVGFDPQFALGRSSGLGTLIPTSGNPTMTALGNLNKGVGGMIRAGLHDDIAYNQTDFRSLAQLAPGYRLLGVKNFVHALEEQFPESRKQE